MKLSNTKIKLVEGFKIEIYGKEGHVKIAQYRIFDILAEIEGKKDNPSFSFYKTLIFSIKPWVINRVLGTEGKRLSNIWRATNTTINICTFIF